MAQAQREISAREFAEWVAYDAIDPIGRERDDWRAAALLTMLANIHRGKGKPAYKLKQFWPNWDRTPPDEETLTAKAQTLFSALSAQHHEFESIESSGRAVQQPMVQRPEQQSPIPQRPTEAEGE